MRVMRDLVGETLSERYRLVSKLAGGGMGDVYRGHDLLLDRPVAVKVLQPTLASDPELVARFKEEARLAARLSHPNIVAVYDWGCEDAQTYFMIMEYVSGTDLRDLLVARGCLKPAQAAEIVAALCDALEAAHSSGLVHRDVKPENVLIARDGKVKVADFGIAVVADADRTMPASGIPGTLRYLAPEQARGLPATPASDIWAAGALFSEALSGLPPLQGSGQEILQRRASEPPVAPSSLDPTIPTDLDDIVLRACALDPQERFSDAAEMSGAVKRAAVRSLEDAAPLPSLLDDLTGEIHLSDMQPTDFLKRRGALKRRSALRVGAVAALIAVVILAGVSAVAAFIAPDPVAVPDLVGIQKTRAARRLAALGLDLEVTGRRRSPGTTRGEVLFQSPSRGKVDEGTRVEVVVSAGLPLVKVPTVVGVSEDKAREALKAAHLKIGGIERKFSKEPEGAVVSQTPGRGRKEWGSRVNLVISKGQKPIAVPAVSGYSSDDAVAALDSKGFAVSLLEAYSDEVEPGVVIYTTPGAGEVLQVGSEVEVVVSLGPEFEEVKVPDVRGRTVADATAKLESLGLQVQVMRSCGKGTRVAETDPIPGTVIRENDTVALFVC